MKECGKMLDIQDIITKSEQTRKFVTRSVLKVFEAEFASHPPPSQISST